MGIVNRRNAMLGWAVWQAGKYAAKQKARTAVPSVDAETKRPNKPAVAAAGIATVAGLAVLLRKVGSGSNGQAPPEE